MARENRLTRSSFFAGRSIADDPPELASGHRLIMPEPHHARRQVPRSCARRGWDSGRLRCTERQMSPRAAKWSDETRDDGPPVALGSLLGGKYRLEHVLARG